jgi:hydroxymethylpyrimidine/phosphomethylpyrimidine kinase
MPVRPSLNDDFSAVTRSDASEIRAGVAVFNATDPRGACGLTADAITIAAVGAHPITIATGAYIGDTSGLGEHVALDDESVREQARAVFEDMNIQAIKVGFVGSIENIGAIAELASDYDELPVIAYMPDLSWWDENEIENYHDAFRELLLPQTSILVGNQSTLWRWLLPEWAQDRSPGPRDIARAAAECGVSHVLVTGINKPEQFIENVLASPESVIETSKFELIDATFCGAGDTLSAALTALIATGVDMSRATLESLEFLDGCLANGFRPGMGHVVPDRMFWAESADDDESNDEEPPALNPGEQLLGGFGLPSPDTSH